METEGIGTFDVIIMIVAIIVVLIVVFYQVRSFKDTKAKILELASIFPNISNLSIFKSSITKSILDSRTELQKFIENPPVRHIETQDDDIDEETSYTDSDDSTFAAPKTEYTDVDLIKCANIRNGAFKEILNETNSYLCKNVGTSADFNILQDICERKIDALETQIQNTLNVPLYLGLGGTFVGIIIGLSGIVFNIDQLFSGAAGSSGPLRNLLFGVAIAMTASLIGLALMTWNTSVEYKKALKSCDSDKNAFYDFIRRELMPNLSNSMSASLNSLKSVLGEFIGKFGRNLSDYANSAELLNDNIEKQHLLLVEINKMNQTQMATKIAETFKSLSDSSEAFEVFHNYQNDLNQTVNEVNSSLSRIEQIISSFENFSSALNVVVENQGTANELQSQFQAAIEQHFPTGTDAREMWRKQFDELSSDATTVSTELNNQLKASTEYIKKFTEENKDTLFSLGSIKEILDSMVQYTNVQATCYKDMKEEIKSLKEAQVKAQADSAKLNADLLTAVKEMIGAIKTIKN
jgi:hypothetical protein